MRNNDKLDPEIIVDYIHTYTTHGQKLSVKWLRVIYRTKNQSKSLNWNMKNPTSEDSRPVQFRPEQTV